MLEIPQDEETVNNLTRLEIKPADSPTELRAVKRVDTPRENLSDHFSDCNIDGSDEQPAQPIPNEDVRSKLDLRRETLLEAITIKLDNRAEFVKLLVDELGFRQRKVD